MPEFVVNPTNRKRVSTSSSVGRLVLFYKAKEQASAQLAKETRVAKKTAAKDAKVAKKALKKAPKKAAKKPSKVAP